MSKQMKKTIFGILGGIVLMLLIAYLPPETEMMSRQGWQYLGCFGFLNSRTIIAGVKALSTGSTQANGPFYATIGGLVSMMLLVKLGRKIPALREYNLGLAMLIGMATAVILA